MDIQLTAKNLKEFLQQNGYEWSGYIAEYDGRVYQDYYKGEKYLSDLDNKYILLGSQYDWDEDKGKVKVVDNKSVKYIRQDEIAFMIYTATYEGQKLEKDLSAEWVRYQALNIKDYISDTLFDLRRLLASYPDIIQDRKNLLAQEIERITRESSIAIRDMEEDFARTKMAAEIIRQVQQERLIKQHIELDAKDDFKDTTSNDACLQHLTDTFGK